VLAAIGGHVFERLRWSVLATPSTLKDMAGLLLVAAITPTFIYFAGLARTRASVATFAEMAQTFASLIITWGVMNEPLTALQVAAGTLLLVAVVFINRAVEGPTTSPEAERAAVVSG
jgi:drug/metabolite transporter (DMT)-like permease